MSVYSCLTIIIVFTSFYFIESSVIVLRTYRARHTNHVLAINKAVLVQRERECAQKTWLRCVRVSQIDDYLIDTNGLCSNFNCLRSPLAASGNLFKVLRNTPTSRELMPFKAVH